jgi:hypothetical protein
LNLDQLTNIAEIVASVATVATLIYLAFEIRTSNKLQRAESRRSVLNHVAPLSIAIGQSKVTSDLFYRGMMEYDKLEPSDKIQFEFLFSVMSSHVDLAFTDWKLGLTDSNSFDSSARDFFNLLQTPGGNAYWRHRSANHAGPFRDYVVNTVFQGQEPGKSKG